MKIVRQEDENGCAIACLAMVLKKTYQQVRKDWKDDFLKDGVTMKNIVNYLANEGLTIVRKTVPGYAHKDSAREEMMRPFAPMHIINIRPLYDSDYHVVVMTADGHLYCPGGMTEDEIRNAYMVDEVIGIYKK